MNLITNFSTRRNLPNSFSDSMIGLLASVIFLLAGSGIVYGNEISHTFRINDANAQAMSVAGEFNEWNGQQMTREADGNWSLKLTLTAGSYGYKFIRNENEWLLDPGNNQTTTIDDNTNSLLVIAKPDKQRFWTQSKTGKMIEGIIKTADAKSVSIQREDGRVLVIPLDTLITEDQEVVKQWHAKPKTTAEVAVSADPAAWHGKLVPGGEPITWRFKVNELPARSALRIEYPEDPPPPYEIEVRIAVPEGFSMTSSDNWMGLVSATSTGDAVCTEAMDMFWRNCLAKGMACMAASLVIEAKDRREWGSITERWGVASAALDEIAKSAPNLKSWTWVPMGFSGGGGYAMFFGACLHENKWKVGGIYTSVNGYGVNHFTPYLKPGRSYYRIPVFMSFGNEDPVYKIRSANYLIEWGSKEFKNFQGAIFDGGHSMHDPHTDQAFDWFKSLKPKDEK